MSPTRDPDVTRLLNLIASGDEDAARAIVPIVYDELRNLAHSYMARQQLGQTLDATCLVHEAYLRLTGGQAKEWTSRGHFYAAAAKAMRHILVDRARRRNALRRGGNRRRTNLDVCELDTNSDHVDLVALDELLGQFKVHCPRAHDVLMLRFFAGLSIDEAALTMNISSATVKRDWNYAKAWLYARLE